MPRPESTDDLSKDFATMVANKKREREAKKRIHSFTKEMIAPSSYNKDRL